MSEGEKYSPEEIEQSQSSEQYFLEKNSSHLGFILNDEGDTDRLREMGIDPEQEKDNLRSFLNYENPNINEYRKLIKSAEFYFGEGEYSRLTLGAMVDYPGATSNDEILRFRNQLRDALNGEVLVDLGAGECFNMAAPLSLYGVSKYLAVNKGDWSKLYDSELETLEYTRFERDNRSMDIYSTEDDMLNFVARIPDNSVSFMLNGIDSTVLGGNEEYCRSLTSEIVRATKPGGVVFGSHSWSFDYLAPGEDHSNNPENTEFEVVKPKGNSYCTDVRMYRKLAEDSEVVASAEKPEENPPTDEGDKKD